MLSQPLASGSKPSEISNKRADAARHAARAGGRRVDAGQQLQQRALAGAVVADDAHAFALFHAQVDVLEGLDFQHILLAAAKQAVEQVVLQARAALTADVEVQAHVVEFDQFHRSSFGTVPGQQASRHRKKISRRSHQRSNSAATPTVTATISTLARTVSDRRQGPLQERLADEVQQHGKRIELHGPAQVPIDEDLGLVNDRRHVEQDLQDDLQQVLRVVEERVERARTYGQRPGKDEQEDQRGHEAQQDQRVVKARKDADGHEDDAHADQEVIARAERRAQRIDGQRARCWRM